MSLHLNLCNLKKKIISKYNIINSQGHKVSEIFVMLTLCFAEIESLRERVI